MFASRKCLCVLLGATHSLLFRVLVCCGSPAGNLGCDIAPKVYDIRAPARAGVLGVWSGCEVLWSGQVGLTSAVPSTYSNEQNEKKNMTL